MLPATLHLQQANPPAKGRQEGRWLSKPLHIAFGYKIRNKLGNLKTAILQVHWHLLQVAFWDLLSQLVLD